MRIYESRLWSYRIKKVELINESTEFIIEGRIKKYLYSRYIIDRINISIFKSIYVTRFEFEHFEPITSFNKIVKYEKARKYISKMIIHDEIEYGKIIFKETIL